MANQQYRIFPNKVELFKFFGQYNADLNVGVSSRLPPNGFAIGTEHKAFRTFPDFIKALGEVSGLNVDEKTSTFRMGTFIVFFKGDIPNPNRRGKEVEAKIAKPETKLVDENKVEVKSATTEATLKTAASLNDESDKAGSKAKLAEFAATKGVTLSKAKTFENMMADFEEALKDLEAK